MWTRDTPLGSVGAPVYVSSGTEIEQVSNSNTQVTFTVNQVPPGGGSVTLGRIAWPGYTATGAALGDPLRGYLLTVNVTPDMAGKPVTVTFRPPGWNVEIASLASALLLGAAWSLIHAFRGRRRERRDEPSAPIDRPSGMHTGAAPVTPASAHRSGEVEPEFAIRKERK
jgi:hypothetical protein